MRLQRPFRAIATARDFQFGSLQPLDTRQSLVVEPRDDPQFQKAVDRNIKAGIGGALLGAPVAILAAFGASEGVMLACLVIAAVVLAAVVVRKRFGS